MRARSIANTIRRIALGGCALALALAVASPPSGPQARRTPHAANHVAVVVPRGDARFLIVGLTQDRQRTDTVEVVQWDDAHHRVRILGIPRDIPIALPGDPVTKLDHARDGRDRAGTRRGRAAAQ